MGYNLNFYVNQSISEEIFNLQLITNNLMKKLFNKIPMIIKKCDVYFNFGSKILKW